jgi:hypothetical protein
MSNDSDNDEIRKTSAEWYAIDTTCDIMDPDGWRRESKPNHFYYKIPITKKEYDDRMRRCSVCGFGKLEHRHPFTKR